MKIHTHLYNEQFYAFLTISFSYIENIIIYTQYILLNGLTRFLYNIIFIICIYSQIFFYARELCDEKIKF